MRGRFHRSVQLARDWETAEDFSGYLVTPTVRSLTKWILEELSRDKGIRAWSITGPYGSGKSAFALFLSRLLAEGLGNHPEAGEFKRWLPRGFKPLIPVLVVGQKASLAAALLSGLAKAIDPIDSTLSGEIKALASGSQPTDAEVSAIFERSAQVAVHHGRSGLMLIVDEFGKFLEHIASGEDDSDLLIMQYLAEAASRSPVPFVVMTILHSGFTAYADRESELRQIEWQKIQGRFQDVAFQEPHEQVLRLIGAAIEHEFTPSLTHRYRELIERTIHSKALDESRIRLPLHELLPSCIPIEPITATLLSPLFRGPLAQNERSLFSFLTSREPYGFQEFLDSANWSADPPPLYRLDQLYDYVGATLGPSLYKGSLGRRWAEIDAAIDRIRAEAPPLTRSVVKALGLLWIYGKAVGLKADAETLSLALGDTGELPDVLEYLERASIIVFRRFEEAYGLWEGSDINLDERYREASQHLLEENLATRLSRQVELRPFVARAHYIRTGTLRYFTLAVTDGVDGAADKASVQGDADGKITFVLTGDETTRANLIREAVKRTTDGPPLEIYAFPKPIVGLERALAQVENWRWVERNTPDLEGDRAARSELEANLRAAQEQLETIAGRVFGLRGHRFAPEALDWVHYGEIYRPKDGPSFQNWLSSLCDRTFHKAPRLRNELLNRRKLSSAAKAALNELVERMVFNERADRFGIEGTPAEVSMYESFIRAGGFHHQDAGWKIGPPRNPEWAPVWEAMEGFLETTHRGRRPLVELYDLLKAPPYGLRDGPLPLLLLAAILDKPGEIALYREGLFLVGLNKELLQLLIHAPENFEIQRFAFTSEGRNTLEAIQQVIIELGINMRARGGSPLLRVAEPLVVSVMQLPDFAKKTRRLDPLVAAELREALLRAKDPHTLLLQEVPGLLGIDPTQPEAERLLAERLHKCLLALYQAYPKLLDQIESLVKATFNLAGTTTEALRTELRERTKPLKGLTVSGDLSRFVNAAGGLDDRDWREVIGQVVMAGKPPSIWTDNDVVDLQVRLQYLYSDFVRLEELGLEKQRSLASRVIHVGVLESKLKEVRESIPVSDEQMPEVQALSEKLAKVLKKMEGKVSRQVRLAALSHLLQQEIERRQR